MSEHESCVGLTDEWYTPPHIFKAMDVLFDEDVASPGIEKTPWLPAKRAIKHESLTTLWAGFVWMNPPFGGRNGYLPWARKFVKHANGVALAPNRTGAPWFSWLLANCEYALFVSPKVKFLRPDGSEGGSPGYGSVLLSLGSNGAAALKNATANGLGVLTKIQTSAEQSA